ncbi:hypothetical protein H6Y62_08995 [Staphylococcus lugdunensis]|uniref:hypothetical protein n=1 Tax=Staphylococcus lugdunensis TaxID=28035 RepID=UPI001AFBB799|nr:hypothetical protein H6Y62_08995 [Staphylococcus lugdunensis]
MRKQIEELIKSDVSTTKIAYKTGISKSIISRLRSGEREIGKLTLETAEKLADFAKLYHDYANRKQIELSDDIEFIDSAYLNYSSISDSTIGYFISFEEIAEIESDDKMYFQLILKYADEIDIDQDIDAIERQIFDDEVEEEVLYFENYESAFAYLKFNYELNDLKELLTEKMV